MPGKSVFITRSIPEAGIALLAASGLSVRMNPLARALRPEELREKAGQHDAVICQISDTVDEAVLAAAAPRCKVFANCAVGFDNIDIRAAQRLGITVTNTPDVLTEATADLTWALMLATARRLGEAERHLRAGAWRGWGMLDFLGADIHGKTLGIVGAGRIGTAVARRASGFSMKVLYADPETNDLLDGMGAGRVSLLELLRSSDFVSLHIPLTESTRMLLDDKALRAMKRSAILINTSRGAVVDESALIEALQRSRIAGAGLDVYRSEPHVPRELLEVGNAVLLPHIGSATVATRSRMAQIAASNVVAVLRGEPALDPVIP
ncbi:MAG: D-glycerate dehydrogenase [Planctomycetota bacterium]